MADWRVYQEEVAELFRSLGCAVETDCECSGARGKHSLDVSVRFSKFGLIQHWVIECKLWKRAIPKERALILAGIVEDIGADRGLLIAEAGHQSGAHQQVEHTNITLTSLAELRKNAKSELLGLGLRQVRWRADIMKTEVSSLYDESREGNRTTLRPKHGTNGAVLAQIFFAVWTISDSAGGAELGKFPVKLFRPELETNTQAMTLEEFVESATAILDSIEPILTEQKNMSSA